ncbi:MAG: uracil-DNA glycosylase [Thermoplasmata archaeon]|nr:uracil-DNA glycosylase [Thermoplasmata archaeon]
MNDKLDELANNIEQCQRCALANSRHLAVPGEGACSKGVVFIGEAPGRKEDETGRPFVGAAGKILDSLLTSVGLSREDVFITSVLKCRPPKNRDPLPGEKEACSPWMEAQLNALRPRVVAPLGRHGLSFIAGRYGQDFGTITQEHGNIYHFKEDWGEVAALPLFHPAALIYHRALMPDAEKDMKILVSLL